MKCLIIDDNKLARMTLRELARQVKGITVAGECASAVEAWDFLREQHADLLFLDIEMPGMTGIELARNLGANRPIIIFTTSKKDYAAEAFELNVADYIVKPVNTARFLQAIEKAREIQESDTEQIRYMETEFIFIRDANIVKRLQLDELLYAEAMGDYVRLQTPGRFYAIRNTMKAVEDRLPPGKFLRVHRSYIVAINKIDSLQDGTLTVNGKPLPVADAYRGALNRALNIL